MESVNTKILFFAFFIIFVSENVSCTEITSQIVFDTEEDERISNNAPPNQEPASNSKFLVSMLHGDADIVRLSNAMKRSHFEGDNLTKQPTITNNIQIVLHENLLNTDRILCKNAICNASMLSRQDENGNIVIDLHIGINGKLNTRFKATDIPIIDGVRGVENSLQFQHLNRSHALTYLHNTIPYIQSRYQGGEPWYQGQRTFEGTRISRPSNSEESGSLDSPRWSHNKSVLDDKIEPPLSETS